MPLDPNLIKAGTVDYSWIKDSVKDGIGFAQARAHLDLNRQLAQSRLQEVQQQHQMVQMQKGMSVFQDIQRAMGETGKVRSTIIDGAKQKAQMFGLNISDDFWAATQDKNYDDKIGQAMANLQNPDQNMRGQALQALSGNIDSSAWTKLAGLSEKTAKDQAAAQNAVAKTNIMGQRNNILAQNAGVKGVKDLRGEADKVEKAYDGPMDNADLAIKELSKGTAAGDQLAMQKYIRSMGNERITVAAVNANTQIGSAMDQILSKTNQYSNGKKFDSNIRSQLISNLQDMKTVGQQEYKTMMDPIVASAQANPNMAAALKSGQIVPMNRLQKFYPDIAPPVAPTSGAGQAQSTGPEKPNAVSRTTAEQGAIQNAIKGGVSLQTINKQLASYGRKPMSPNEYSQWQSFSSGSVAPQGINVRPPQPQGAATIMSAPQSSSQGSSQPQTMSDVMSGGPGIGSTMGDDESDEEN